jgi:hypothetical protein
MIDVCIINLRNLIIQMQNQKQNYAVEHKTLYTPPLSIYHEHAGYSQPGMKTSAVGATEIKSSDVRRL